MSAKIETSNISNNHENIEKNASNFQNNQENAFDILSNLVTQFASSSRTKVEFQTKQGNIYQALLTNCSKDGLLQMKKVEVIKGIESLKTRVIDHILVKTDRIASIKILSTDWVSPSSQCRSPSWNVSKSGGRYHTPSSSSKHSTPSSGKSCPWFSAAGGADPMMAFSSPQEDLVEEDDDHFDVDNNSKLQQSPACAAAMTSSIKADLTEFVQNRVLTLLEQRCYPQHKPRFKSPPTAEAVSVQDYRIPCSHADHS